MSDMFFSSDTTAVQWYFGKYKYKVTLHIKYADMNIHSLSRLYRTWKNFRVDSNGLRVTSGIWKTLEKFKRLTPSLRIKVSSSSISLYSNDDIFLKEACDTLSSVIKYPVSYKIVAKECVNQQIAIREKNVIFQKNPKFVKRIFMNRKLKKQERINDFINENTEYLKVSVGFDSVLNNHSFSFLHNALYIDFADEKLSAWFLLEFCEDVLNTADIKKIPYNTDKINY